MHQCMPVYECVFNLYTCISCVSAFVHGQVHVMSDIMRMCINVCMYIPVCLDICMIVCVCAWVGACSCVYS